MNPLLDGRFAPLTWEIGFLEAPADVAVQGFLDWRREHGRFEAADIAGDLPLFLCRLAPLTDIEPSRYLFAPTKTNWTAFFDNGWRGTDAFGPMSVLAERVGCRGVRARWVPDAATSPAERRGTVLLSVYAPTATEYLNYERSLAVVNDGDRWRFVANGTPFPFEELDRYGARRKRDRFTPEMLDAYLRRLGITMFDETFYAPEGRATVIDRRGRLPRGTKTYRVDACDDVLAAQHGLTHGSRARGHLLAHFTSRTTGRPLSTRAGKWGGRRV